MIDPATFWNLVAWSLQVLVVAIVGGALPSIVRLTAPPVRHAYFRVLLAGCLLLPVLQPRQVAPPPLSLAGADEQPSFGLSVSVRAPAHRRLVLPSLSRESASVLVVLLVVGVGVGRLGWLALGLARLRRLRSAGRAVSLEALAAGTPADIRYVDELRQPVTFGLRHPVVLLPARLESARPDVRRAVLEHELWHVRRRDWLWVTLEEGARAVFWFHPGIVWLIGRIQLTREEVVDELTVLSTNARRSYLEALLAFADEPPVYPATPFARRAAGCPDGIRSAHRAPPASTPAARTCCRSRPPGVPIRPHAPTRRTSGVSARPPGLRPGGRRRCRGWRRWWPRGGSLRGKLLKSWEILCRLRWRGWGCGLSPCGRASREPW